MRISPPKFTILDCLNNNNKSSFVFTEILIIIIFFANVLPFTTFPNIFTSVNKPFMHDISHVLIIFFYFPFIIFTKQQKFSFAALLLLYFCNIF